MTAALHVDNLTVARRKGPTILSSVSLSVAAGECLAIVGPSGAGKSVLAKTLLGLIQEDSGWQAQSDAFHLDEVDVTHASTRRWRNLRGARIALVLQDALQSLDPLRTIGSEVSEVLQLHGLRRSARHAVVRESLSRAGLDDPGRLAKQRSGELSGGMRQRALIAAALAGDPQVVVADEPTTALDAVTASEVIRLFGQIRDSGKSIVFISHDLEAVGRIADRIAVLEGGCIVEEGPAAQLLKQPQHRITRMLLEASRSLDRPANTVTPSSGELVSAVGLRKSFAVPGGRVQALDGVDVKVLRGQSLGIVGQSGSGKTTLARILIGAEVPDGGKVSVYDENLRVRLIPQDPLGSFDPRWKVGRIIGASLRRGAIEDLLQSVGLPAQMQHRYPATLSGGQRQRVAIARALATNPDVLVCDEPVSALDTTTQAGILDLLRKLQCECNLAIVFISHDLRVVRSICQNVVVMQAGHIVEAGATEEVLHDPHHRYTKQLVDAATNNHLV